MLRLTIKADLNEARRFVSGIKESQVMPAAVRAINKTLGNVRTEASKNIRAERSLSAKVVRDALVIDKATRGNLSGALVASGRPIPLSAYGARKLKKGVSVLVSPAGGRKIVTHAGNKAFILDSIGGNVFARETGSRLPIKKLYGPSIPETFLKDVIAKAMQRSAEENWEKRFAEELSYQMRSSQ